MATKVPFTLQSFRPRIHLRLLLLGVVTILPRAASFAFLPSSALSSSKSTSACQNRIKMSSTSQSAAAAEAVATTTLGPTALRTLVQNASIESQLCLDLNGIVWLEHLNLVVGDMDLALKFYVYFLGLARDSNPKHVNLGQQQVRYVDAKSN